MADQPNFDDPAMWDVVPDVAVFDEHDEPGPDGKPVRFDRAALGRIAERCNYRDEIGQPCPLTLGHTREGAPEDQQPEIVGYARRFTVAYDPKLGRHVIRCAYYLRKDKAARAREYPRTSVERWLKGDYFDPIALIKRTPQRPVGNWTYAKGGRVARYALEEPMPDPALPPVGAPEGVDPKFHDDVMKCVRHSYPGLDGMHQKYAADAAAAGPGVPGGSNVDPPRPVDDKLRMQLEQEKVRYARIEADLTALKAERDQARAQADRADCERLVTQLEAEQYQLDRAAEVESLLRLPAAERSSHCDRVRRYYRKAPAGEGWVRTAPAPGPSGRAASQAEHEAALRLATKEKLDFPTALARVRG